MTLAGQSAGQTGDLVVVYLTASEGECVLAEHVESREVSAPRAAREALRDQQTDCLVVEHDPPDVDGPAFLDSLSPGDRTIPTVVYDPGSDPRTAGAAVRAGADEYVPGELDDDDDPEDILRQRVSALAGQPSSQAGVDPWGAFEAVGDGIVVHDISSETVLDCNAAFADLLGYERGDLLGASISDIGDADQSGELTLGEAAREAIEGSGSKTFDWVARTESGDPVPVEVHLSLSEDGTERRAVSVVRDVSARVARERQLEARINRLERFGSVVTHDLRSPLQSAHADLALLRQDSDSEYIDDLAGRVNRMGAVVEDVLSLTRGDEEAITFEHIDLDEVVEAAWEDAAPESATLIGRSLGAVQADRPRLRRLLENLFRNAVEHGDESVTVRVSRADEGSGFVVADDGPGIPPEEREHVLEHGYTTDEDGNGFGLGSVERLADLHGWGVTIGESPAGGARFEITDADF